MKQKLSMWWTTVNGVKVPLRGGIKSTLDTLADGHDIVVAMLGKNDRKNIHRAARNHYGLNIMYHARHRGSDQVVVVKV